MSVEIGILDAPSLGTVDVTVGGVVSAGGVFSSAK